LLKAIQNLTININRKISFKCWISLSTTYLSSLVIFRILIYVLYSPVLLLNCFLVSYIFYIVYRSRQSSTSSQNDKQTKFTKEDIRTKGELYPEVKCFHNQIGRYHSNVGFLYPQHICPVWWTGVSTNNRYSHG
jgi:hypothetical protein